MNLRKLRTAVAAVVLVAITLLFLDFTGTAHRFLGWLAKIQLLPALLALNVGVVALLVVLTLLDQRLVAAEEEVHSLGHGSGGEHAAEHAVEGRIKVASAQRLDHAVELVQDQHQAAPVELPFQDRLPAV